MWLEAKKRVKYTWVPKIMINDWVNKGHTNLNMFSVVDEQIRSLSSKQSKLNFWNQLHPKIALLCRFWTQTATWRPNHTILTSSVIAILKAMIDTVFLGPSSGGVRIFYERWEFFTTRESTLGPTGWSLSYTLYLVKCCWCYTFYYSCKKLNDLTGSKKYCFKTGLLHLKQYFLLPINTF